MVSNSTNKKDGGRLIATASVESRKAVMHSCHKNVNQKFKDRGSCHTIVVCVCGSCFGGKTRKKIGANKYKKIKTKKKNYLYYHAISIQVKQKS